MSKLILLQAMRMCLVFAVAVAMTGCNEEDKRTTAMIASSIISDIQQLNQTDYQRPYWKAEDYFTDTKIIALCNAIQKRDIPLIDKLINEGADVNAKGKGNMTPLLWAFVQCRPWNRPPSLSKQNRPGFTEKWATEEFDVVHLAIFTKLLEHGADPNVQFTATFFVAKGELNGNKPHQSITQCVAHLAFPYFETVMKNRGNHHLYYDMNRAQSTYVDRVVRNASIAVSRADSLKKLQYVINAGVNLNQVDGDGNTPLCQAVRCNRFDEAILLVEAGADWEMAIPGDPGYIVTLLSIMLAKDDPVADGVMPDSKLMGDEGYVSYLKLIKVLEEKGADFDEEREYRRIRLADTMRMSPQKARPIEKERERRTKERKERFEQKQQQKER